MQRAAASSMASGNPSSRTQMPATAAAFALVSHVISFVPITLLGLAFLAGSGLSFGRLAEPSGDKLPT